MICKSREILFRGKPIVCKELMEPNETLKEFFKRQHGWSDYGVNEAFTDDGFVIGQVVYGHEKVWIVGEVVEAEEDYIALEYWVPVNPETVGQYTGLKDRNGVKIFEGDYIYHHWHKDTAYLVWHERYICFVGKPFEEDTSKTYHYQKPDEPDLEVIGNIHDNPELLEV